MGDEKKIDHYAVLGLSDNASKVDVRKAFKKLALETHPDKNPNIDKSIFQQINKAHEILSDEQKRAKYDDSIKLGSRQQPIRQPIRQLVSFKSVMQDVKKDIIDNIKGALQKISNVFDKIKSFVNASNKTNEQKESNVATDQNQDNLKSNNFENEKSKSNGKNILNDTNLYLKNDQQEKGTLNTEQSLSVFIDIEQKIQNIKHTLDDENVKYINSQGTNTSKTLDKPLPLAQQSNNANSKSEIGR